MEIFYSVNTHLAKRSGLYAKFRAQRIIDNTPSTRLPVCITEDDWTSGNYSIPVHQGSDGNNQLNDDLDTDSLSSLILESIDILIFSSN